ncbi:MAG: gamma carbonic anhydrase family protein [Euryarchaeota archaeon]|nr:gamma carbonic anhydrase family protein [Euryarchaeota archaeon]
MRMRPKVHDSCYVHRTAVIIGDVTISENCGIWPNAVVRGDESSVFIGKNSNIQDCCVIHVTTDTPTKIGDNVSLGHGCVVHGATIGNDVIVGMKAVVLNRAVIGDGCVIAAGALVKEGAVIPPGSLVVGVPGKVVRESDAGLGEYARKNAATYVDLARRHRNGEWSEYEHRQD